MKKAIKLVAAIVIALAAVIFFGGGIHYWSETEYRGEEETGDSAVVVKIQNREGSIGGSPGFITLADDGPPFDIVIYTNLSGDQTYTAAQVRGMTISDGTAILAAFDETSMMEMQQVRPQPNGTSFLFMQEAFRETPKTISVRGVVRLFGASGTADVKIEKSFRLAQYQRIDVLGWTRTWEQ